MDRRTFIRNVLEGKRSDRLPRAIFGGGLWSFRQCGLKIEDLAGKPVHFGESIAGLFSEFDTDIIFAGSGLNTLPAEMIGGKLAFREGQAPLLSFPIIEKTEDARYLYQLDISHSPYTIALVEMISRIRELLPDRFLCATSWGPFTWAMILCDWNLLREKTVTDREFVKEICELGVRLSLSFYAPLIERNLIDGISIPDGAVTLIPQELYEEVVIPCERKLFDSVREKGIKSVLHQCGNISAQVELYPATGADCISLDAGVSIGDVYNLYRDKTVTAGNIDVINTIFGGDPSNICKKVTECVSAIADPFHKYILMPSCDLPSETPIKNVKEFLSCADRMS